MALFEVNSFLLLIAQIGRRIWKWAHHGLVQNERICVETGKHTPEHTGTMLPLSVRFTKSACLSATGFFLFARSGKIAQHVPKDGLGMGCGSWGDRL